MIMQLKVCSRCFVLVSLAYFTFGENAGLRSSECHRGCDDNLKITDLQPFATGCTLVQWSDTSSCSAANTQNSTKVHYTLEILKNCSDQNPLDTVQLINSTNHTVTIKAFNVPVYDVKSFHLRVKAESDGQVCRWKSRCYLIHQELQINTTYCDMTSIMKPCISVAELRTSLCDRDRNFPPSLPQYFLGSERQSSLENTIKNSTFEGCFELNVTDNAVLSGKCEYINARIYCQERCNVQSVPEIVWRTVFLFSTDHCEERCQKYLQSNDTQSNDLSTESTLATLFSFTTSTSKFNLVIANVLFTFLTATLSFVT